MASHMHHMHIRMFRVAVPSAIAGVDIVPVFFVGDVHIYILNGSCYYLMSVCLGFPNYTVPPKEACPKR